MEQKPSQSPKDISNQATKTESNLISFNSATKPHDDEGAECEDEEMTKNLPDGYQDGKEGTSTYEQFLKRVHTLAMGNDKRENNPYNGNHQQDCVHDLSGTGSIASLQSFGRMERQITPLGEATLCTEIGWESRYRDLESRFRSLDRQVHDIVRENKIMRNIVIQNDNQGCTLCQHMLAQITQLGKEIQAALSSNSQDEMTHKHVPAKMPTLDQCEDTAQRSRDQHVLKTSYPGSGAEMLQTSQIHEKMEQESTKFPKDGSIHTADKESNLTPAAGAAVSLDDCSRGSENEQIRNQLLDAIKDSKEDTSNPEQIVKHIQTLTLAMNFNRRHNNSSAEDNHQTCVHHLSGTDCQNRQNTNTPTTGENLSDKASEGESQINNILCLDGRRLENDRQSRCPGKTSFTTEIDWESKFRAMESKLMDMESQSKAMESESRVKESRLNDMESQIGVMKSQIVAMESRFGALESRFGALELKVPEIGKLKELRTIVMKLQTQNAEIVKCIAQNNNQGCQHLLPHTAQFEEQIESALSNSQNAMTDQHCPAKMRKLNGQEDADKQSRDQNVLKDGDEMVQSSKTRKKAGLMLEKVYNKSLSEPNKPTPQMAAAGTNGNTVSHLQNQQEESVTQADPNEIHLLLIGNTGHGKSATGNSILNEAKFKKTSSTSVESSPSLESIVQASTTIGDKLVHVIDGPSINYSETMKKEDWEMIMKAVDKSLELCNCGFNALLITQKFGNRFTNQEREAIKVIKAVFGENVIKDYGICIFTYGDNFDNAVEEAAEFKKILTFQSWLQEQTGEMKNLIEECKNRCVLFDNSTKDPNKKEVQVQKLLALIPQGKKYSEKEFLQAEEGQHQLASVAALPAMMKEMQKVTGEIERKIVDIEADKDIDMATYKILMESLILYLNEQNNRLHETGLTTPDVEGMKMHINMLNIRINTKIKQRLTEKEIKKYNQSKDRGSVHVAAPAKDVCLKKQNDWSNGACPSITELQNRSVQADDYEMVHSEDIASPEKYKTNIYATNNSVSGYRSGYHFNAIKVRIANLYHLFFP